MTNQGSCWTKSIFFALPKSLSDLLVQDGGPFIFQFMTECCLQNKVGGISWLLMEIVGRVTWHPKEVMHNGHHEGQHCFLCHLQNGTHTACFWSHVLVRIFAGMHARPVMGECGEFPNWHFLHACRKTCPEAHEKVCVPAGWKDFLDHPAPSLVCLPVAATATTAAGVMADGIAILHQVSANSEADKQSRVKLQCWCWCHFCLPWSCGCFVEFL